MADPVIDRRGIEKSAALSADGKNRYFLARTIGPGPTATFIMLNPSTADAELDDPTVRKCLGFCRRWGCGRLHVVNLFALRTSKPADLKRAVDPVGPDNHSQFVRAIGGRRRSRQRQSEAGPVVCAWGTQGGFMGRDREVMDWLSKVSATKLTCLGFTTGGHPRHPLYVPYSARLIPYPGRGHLVARRTASCIRSLSEGKTSSTSGATLAVDNTRLYQLCRLGLPDGPDHG